MPPKMPPGPTCVAQTILPVAASSAQYVPPLVPAPTSVVFPAVNRFGPEPKSASGLLGSGQFGCEVVCPKQATVQLSKAMVPVAQRTAPVFRSNAIIESNKSWFETVVTPLGTE